MSIYEDYAAFSATTAIYPQQVAAEYLSLGLCSEAAECLELTPKITRTGVTKIGNEIGGEAGDICYYVTRLAVTYDISFSNLVLQAKQKYDPSYNSVDDILCLIIVDAGLIAGKVKKQLRDGHSWTGEQREEARRYIREKLIDILVSLMQLSDWMHANNCDAYNSFDKMLKANRAKLESRLERGVLAGSGNHR